MAQRKRKEVGFIKEEMIVEALVIPEVIGELKDTTHPLTQQEGFLHRSLLLGTKERDMRWTV
jgi:hypothetical protein